MNAFTVIPSIKCECSEHAFSDCGPILVFVHSLTNVLEFSHDEYKIIYFMFLSTRNRLVAFSTSMSKFFIQNYIIYIILVKNSLKSPY